MSTSGIYKTNGLIYNAFNDQKFNTITFGDASAVNLDKQDIFPLLHISITGVKNTEVLKTISYQLILLDVIDVNSLDGREMSNDFHLTDNTEDILHSLDHKFNKAWYTFTENTQDMTPPSVSSQPFFVTGANRLAGYEISFDIQIKNDNIC